RAWRSKRRVSPHPQSPATRSSSIEPPFRGSGTTSLCFTPSPPPDVLFDTHRTTEVRWPSNYGQASGRGGGEGPGACGRCARLTSPAKPSGGDQQVGGVGINDLEASPVVPSLRLGADVLNRSCHRTFPCVGHTSAPPLSCLPQIGTELATVFEVGAAVDRTQFEDLDHVRNGPAYQAERGPR